MATRLFNSEKLIINQLLDTGVFTRNANNNSKGLSEAAKSLEKPGTQQKINNYFHDLLGTYPENIQENLLLMVSNEYESSETVHVLLATIKTVINMPELQEDQADRDILVQTVVRQVQSEVVELDEKEIRRLITKLFVERFKLFTLDYPEFDNSDQNQEISEYWNVSLDFNLIAQAIVNKLTIEHKDKLTDMQRVNRALLLNRYISSKESPHLWNVLLEKKEKIAEQWNRIDRFYLECGDDYALLLDRTRQQAKSKPAVVAIAVAHKIHSGISESELNQMIKTRSTGFFPNNQINISQVKEVLNDFGLVDIRNNFVFPTPIVPRFTTKK